MNIYLNNHLDTLDTTWALAQVSAERREQALRYRHETGRRQSLAAYLLLRQGLHDVFGINECPTLVYGEHGKPSIAGRSDVGFNMSHTRGVAACAVGHIAVGIDVEMVRQPRPALLTRVLSKEEQARVTRDAQPDRAFTRLWTQKESVVKLRGTGLTDALPHLLDAVRDEVAWRTFDGDGYVCTISIERRDVDNADDFLKKIKILYI